MNATRKSWIHGVCVGFVASLVATYIVKKLRSRKLKEKKIVELQEECEESKNIKKEQLVRTTQFFGEEGQKRLDKAFVVVVGVGGVGSHCSLSLARSGVGHLKFIDFDNVSLSSLNRHACATRQHVGLPKVEILKHVIEDILPSTIIETHQTCFSKQVAAELLLQGNRKPDYVIDCIDNIPTKVDLITFCYENQIPCISSGGSGGKADPTKIRIDFLENTTNDTLSASIRRLLRKQGLTDKIMICYSTERNGKELLPLQSFHEDNAEAYRLLDHFRIRVMPVNAPLAAIFGQSLAIFVMCELTKQRVIELNTTTAEADSDARLSRRNYKQLFNSIKQFSIIKLQDAKTSTKELELSFEETRWLYSHIYTGMCVITKRQLKPGFLQLVPWRNKENNIKASMNQKRNVICLKQSLAQKHLAIFSNEEADKVKLEQIWDQETIDMIDTMLQNQEIFNENVC